mmetsp:Transcript_11291/g.16881  ORF Transcript_11291/g.16881 Transcript_11291/m.16881 type:complete len:936 (+) Transcript_11291:148-2955(+)
MQRQSLFFPSWAAKVKATTSSPQPTSQRRPEISYRRQASKQINKANLHASYNNSVPHGRRAFRGRGRAVPGTRSGRGRAAPMSWAARIRATKPQTSTPTLNNSGDIPRTVGFKVTQGFDVQSDSTGKNTPSKKVPTPTTNSKPKKKGLLVSIIPDSKSESKSKASSSAESRARLKSVIKKASREYFQLSADCEEFVRRSKEAMKKFGGVPMKAEVIKIVIRFSLDQKESARMQLSTLLEYLTNEKVFSSTDVFNGMYYLASRIDDIIMDVPGARRMLAKLVSDGTRFGLSPKQLRQLGAVANNKPTKAIKNKLRTIIREYLQSNDVKEVVRSYLELKSPHFGHQLIKNAVSMGMDGSKKETKMVQKLISHLHERKVVKAQEMAQGFEKLLEILGELCKDVLDATQRLADSIEEAIRCGALSPAFLKQVHLHNNDKGSEVVEIVRKRLKDSPKGIDREESESSVNLNKKMRIPSVKKVEIVNLEDETPSDILVNPSFGKPVAQSPLKDPRKKIEEKKIDEVITKTSASSPSLSKSAPIPISKPNQDLNTMKLTSNLDEEGADDKENKAVKQADSIEKPLEAIKEDVGETKSEPKTEKWVVPQRRKTSLEDFTLESVVGRGSYGKVFLVKHRKLKSLFAMKVLRKQDIVERDVVDNIQLERKVLETVDHPFLVALRYAFQTPAKLYMVMDYIPGGEVFNLLASKHELTTKDTRFYAAELVVALQHLHSLNIVYRDLKPENILLHSDGHLALTDFGFAKTGVGKDGKTRSFCGTVDYMAPEVILKTGHGLGVDWWALGVVLYEMAVGRMPFSGANRKATQHAICHHKLKFPKFFDFDLRMLLQGLLRRNVKKRFGCGKNGAEDIKKHEFFDDIKWEVVEKKGLTPPFIPELKTPTDVSNFDPEFTKEPVVDSDSEYPEAEDNTGFFRGFSYEEDSKYI